MSEINAIIEADPKLEDETFSEQSESSVSSRSVSSEIEVDPRVLDQDDDDSYDSSGYETTTASLTSSVHHYLSENGRQYHSYYGTEKYLMPTDEKEQERLDLHHEIARLAWDGKLHEAPLDIPHRILDIGTGTGIWAIEMADKFPTAEVTGTDLSPIQPDWVPSNCKFEVDDAMSPWTFKNDYFDYIHSRNISSGVSDWDHYIGEIKRCVSPGGYVEICEEAIAFFCDDGTMKPDNPAKIYIDQLRASMIKMRRPPPDLKFLQDLLEKAGFENVKAMQVKEPVGPWPKDPRLKTIGAMVLLHGDSAFESYGMALFTRVLGMDAKAAKHLCDEGLRAVRNKNYHMYSCFYRVYGRKPVESNKREA